MSDLPLLTLGIPHLDRSELLERTLSFCLAQTVPCRIIVANQGRTDETARVMRQYVNHPNVEHHSTDSTCLWENWDYVARRCETPFFAWVQDDDVIGPGFANRVLLGFDVFKKALHWQARLYASVDEKLGAWWGGNGPWVPMEMLSGRQYQWPGEVLIPTMYLTSWAMSPAVAFRTGPEFTAALDAMPHDCDLHAERLILAHMGSQGPWIADPAIVGYWVHHGKNESYKQHADQARQNQVLIDHLDRMMDMCDDWQDKLHQWCCVMNPGQVLGFLNNFECHKSRYAEMLKAVLANSLKGRVEQTDCPEHLRNVDATGWQGFNHAARGNGQVAHQDLSLPQNA